MIADRSGPAGPDAALRQRPLRLLFLATRPAFLTLTAVGVVVGWAGALHDGAAWHTGAAVATLLFVLLAHAGANVLNDFHDIASDAQNVERIYPFTGGSRFIQDGLLAPQATRRFGKLLLLSVIPGGLWLTHASHTGLLWIGLAGLALAWAYSAPPLRLSARGLGEFAIVAGWALVVVGSDYVLRGRFAALPLATGSAFGLLAAAANFGVISRHAALALLALLPAMRAWRILRAWLEGNDDLRIAIRSTILMAHAFGLLMAAGLLMAGI